MVRRPFDPVGVAEKERIVILALHETAQEAQAMYMQWAT
jgi:hypothetical protein